MSLTIVRADPVVGQSVPRREDARFLRGESRYVADLVAADDLHVAFVRATTPHGVPRRIDTSAAVRLDGVIGVWTAADLPEAGDVTALTEPHPDFVAAYHFWMAAVRLNCLADERIRYVGEPVAVVVATSRAIAEDAAELVLVDVDELPVITAPRQPGPDLHGSAEHNAAAGLSVEFGTPPVPAADADLVTVELDLVIDRHAGVPLEPRGVRAVPTTDGVDVSLSTQVPHLVRQAIASATGWEESSIVVRVPDVGGGFGTKANVYPEEIVIPVLARRLGRTVVWLEDRTEHLLAAAEGRDQLQHVRLRVHPDGRIASLQVDLDIDVGSTSLWTAGIVANSAIHLFGPYLLPHALVRASAWFSNKAPSAQYRGAGRPEACFALERSLDAAADRLGLSRVEIRRRNLLGAAALPHRLDVPYRDGVPICFDGDDWLACLDDVLEALGPTATATVATSPGERVGWGVACYVEATGRGPYEAARVRLTREGTLDVATGGASSGQSHETVFAQVVADAARVDFDRVRVQLTDTATVGHGLGTYASRTAVLAGNAAHAAAVEVACRLRRALGVGPDAPLSFDATGCFVDDHVVGWDELAASHPDGWAHFDVTWSFEPSTVTWTMGAHAVIVAVDIATGGVRVVRYAVVHEGGRELNPAVVVGQVQGGVAQGIGGALLEASRYDESGVPVSVTMADYLLPNAADVPRISVGHRLAPTPHNPLGVRGVGESGTIAVGAAIASAIEDALSGEIVVRRTPIEAARLRGLVGVAVASGSGS